MITISMSETEPLLGQISCIYYIGWAIKSLIIHVHRTYVMKKD